MAVDESKRKELRGALIRLFLGWVVALVLVELVVTSVESLLLAPWLGATVRVDYALGDSFGFLGALRWAFAAVWQVFFVNGAGSLSVTNRGIALFILGMMVVLVVAPVVAAALLFARQAEKLVSDELEARDDELRHAYERRNLMISDMAHDLRTPVMGISGLAQALADGLVSDDAVRERMLRSIEARASKMADLVTMLFDFVKLESEGFELERKDMDLAQLMLREAAAVYTDMEDAGMELVIDVPEEPAMIWADESQMARVVANLLSNAARHNGPGTTIELALGRRAGVADIIVADTGKPIEQAVDELFEPFSRGDIARAGGGSGLGLSIVKGIVDMHGYQIALKQPYGDYTKAFVVTCELA